MEWPAHFGDQGLEFGRLRAIMKFGGHKQGKLASHLGLSQPLISYFFLGKRTPSKKQVREMEIFLKCQWGWLEESIDRPA